MENMEEKDTLPNLQTVLDAINSLKQDVNEQITGLRREMNEQISSLKGELQEIKTRLTTIENDMREVKEMQFVFENEFDRLLAFAHKSLELSHENRADFRIMRREIEPWSDEVRNLERRVA